ncbi:MAG: helix-turn-helix transcriptional regulator [Hyphomonadaceae bacterium]|nr:helix-turn-helix transcriptional regulator [Hyphomonadaceae bacterium]
MTLNFEGGEMSAGAIAALFKHAWPTTTRHLQVLEAAGLLRHERRGRERFYRIEKNRLELARDWLAWFFKSTG